MEMKIKPSNNIILTRLAVEIFRLPGVALRRVTFFDFAKNKVTKKNRPQSAISARISGRRGGVGLSAEVAITQTIDLKYEGRM